MKHKDFKPCQKCGKGIMHCGNPIFLRVSIERMGVNKAAVDRAHGLELLVGNPVLANVMGPNEDLAVPIDRNMNMLICGACAADPLEPYFWMEDNTATAEQTDGNK